MNLKEAFFYEDNGMVASNNLGWIQTAFDMLTGILDRVGLRKNFRKTVGMVCQPCRADGVWADKAYKRRMMGYGRSYQERHRERVRCTECGKDLARGSLDTHYQNHHGVVRGRSGQEDDDGSGGGKPRKFRMILPVKAGPRPCPVEGCSGRAATRTAMGVHFWYQYTRYTVVIME